MTTAFVFTDANVTRVLQTARGNRGMSVKELILKSGMDQSTYHRRQSKGGWTATELAALAQALDMDPALFLRDADDLLPRRLTTEGEQGGGPIHRYVGRRVVTTGRNRAA